MGRTFHKSVGIYHTVTAAEVSSGIARVSITNSAPLQKQDNLLFNMQVMTGNNSGVVKTSFATHYDINSGVLHVSNGSDNIVPGDKIHVIGMFYA